MDDHQIIFCVMSDTAANKKTRTNKFRLWYHIPSTTLLHFFFPCSTVALKCKQTESTAAAWRDLAFALPWKFMRASSLLYWRKETWRKAKQTRRSSQLLIREKEYDEPKYCNRAPTLCCCCCCFYIYWIYIQVKLLTDAIYWRHPILAIRIV